MSGRTRTRLSAFLSNRETGVRSAGTLNIVFHAHTLPTAADRDTLVLQVGSRSDSFAFSDAFVSGGRIVSWTSADLDWSEEEYVIVRLREK